MKKTAVLLIGLLVLLGAVIAVRALPEGAQITVGLSETRNVTAVGNLTADAGNVTNVNITLNQQTAAWQGFFGDVNGSLVLEDASGDRFYSWTVFNVSGEVYASRDSAIIFANIFPNNNCSIDESLTSSGVADSVNRTYTNNSNVAITVGNVVINASTACATFTFVSNASQVVSFNSIILTDDANVNATGQQNSTLGGNTSVYATPIAGNVVGYDGQTHDYQLLVPVSRALGFNTYFFYAELS